LRSSISIAYCSRPCALLKPEVIISRASSTRNVPG
jgi:hypothetical protein